MGCCRGGISACHVFVDTLAFFFTQSTVHVDQLLVVAVGIDSLTRLQQLKVDDTLLIPPNTQHRLPSEAIWSRGRC